MKHIESAHQAQVVEWARWAYKAKPTQSRIAKEQGMLSGVPDLFLPVPRQNYHGLYIEMKSQKGRVTDNQEWFLSKTEGLGYKTVICYSAKEAISAIQAYYDQETIKGTTQDLLCLKTQNRAYSDNSECLERSLK